LSIGTAGSVPIERNLMPVYPILWNGIPVVLQVVFSIAVLAFWRIAYRKGWFISPKTKMGTKP
jgi:hypothetical protein